MYGQSLIIYSFASTTSKIYKKHSTYSSGRLMHRKSLSCTGLFSLANFIRGHFCLGSIFIIFRWFSIAELAIMVQNDPILKWSAPKLTRKKFSFNTRECTQIIEICNRQENNSGVVLRLYLRCPCKKQQFEWSLN